MSQRPINMPFVWALIFALGVLVEGVGLGRPEGGDTLTEAVQLARWDPVGRFLVVPLWAWLTWHFILRPETTPMFTWRDGLAFTAGVLYAVLEARRG